MTLNEVYMTTQKIRRMAFIIFQIASQINSELSNYLHL